MAPLHADRSQESHIDPRGADLAETARCPPASPSLGGITANPGLLVVDEDGHARDAIASTLSRLEIDVRTASCGAEALALAGRTNVDLVVSELYLPDMTGIHLMNRWRKTGAEPSFLFMGADLTLSAAVAAMQIGALTVLEKPLELSMLTAIVSHALRRDDRSASTHAAVTSPSRVNRPRPVADRWAGYVWKACESVTDPKTLSDWARFTGISYSSLCEVCCLLGIRPHAARDLTRVLRAIVQAPLEDCRPEVLLDVSDRRTLRNLLRRTGSASGADMPASVEELLLRQTFIPAGNEGIIALRAVIARSRRPG